MKVAVFSVSTDFCGECTFALQRFIGEMDGVESINIEHGKIVVKFDEKIVSDDFISKITKDSIEKLGYRIEE